MATSQEHLMTWLRDAHAMEKQAIESIENQLSRLENYPQMRAWVEEHLAASRRQRERVGACLEQRGEKTSSLKDAAMTVMGKIQELTGTAASDEVLKNAITDYSFKHFEVAAYTSLAAAADAAGDAEVSRIASEIKAEEESLASKLAALIPTLTHDYVSRDVASVAAKR